MRNMQNISFTMNNEYFFKRSNACEDEGAGGSEGSRGDEHPGLRTAHAEGSLFPSYKMPSFLPFSLSKLLQIPNPKGLNGDAGQEG